MEHRCGSRQKLNLQAEIEYRGQIYGVLSTRDISVNGIFVRVAITDISEGDFVRVKIDPRDIDTESDDDILDIGAIVLHASGNGMGLMWTEHDVRLDRLLNKPSKARYFGSQ